MGNRVIQQIRGGSLNFRLEIEEYSNSAETTFGKLNEDLRKVTAQVERTFLENDGRNAKFDGALFEIIEQIRERNKPAIEKEAKEKEKKKEMK